MGAAYRIIPGRGFVSYYTGKNTARFLLPALLANFNYLPTQIRTDG